MDHGDISFHRHHSLVRALAWLRIYIYNWHHIWR